METVSVTLFVSGTAQLQFERVEELEIPDGRISFKHRGKTIESNLPYIISRENTLEN